MHDDSCINFELLKETYLLLRNARLDNLSTDFFSVMAFLNRLEIELFLLVPINSIQLPGKALLDSMAKRK